MKDRRPDEEFVIALAGQPNCGKSTLFNAVAGFKVDTGNFAGTTVSYTETKVLIGDRTVRLIDLPGTYSISSYDVAEKVARDYLLSGQVDVIVNVLDAALLSRSLELTIQLMEMHIPMVVGLNMFDEARKKGIEIDVAQLSEQLGVEAYPVIAVEGTGVHELFDAALRVARGRYEPVKPVYDRDVEECIHRITVRYPDALRRDLPMDERFVIIRLLEMDEEFEGTVGRTDADFLEYVRAERRGLAEMHGWPESGVFSSHRHAIVFDLFEKVSTVKPFAGMSLTERVDRFIINPVGGLITVVGLLILMFSAAFVLGDVISGLIEGPLDSAGNALRGMAHGLTAVIIAGLYDGLISGIGIVLPYLIPLLVLLAILEDSGLLPRIAFMVDGILHHFGMHGKSVVPLILGYGCNVPAIMAVRGLEYERDRVLTMLVIPFISCSARTVVILALAGKYLGGLCAAFIFVGNVAVALMVSFFLSRFGVDTHPGIIMDVPPLRQPYLHIVARKVWARLYDFFVFAWPVIIVSSVVLSLLSHAGIDNVMNVFLSPLTEYILDLPENTGVTLFLGIFRKELTLIMLNQALGTSDVSAVLTQVQILVLTVFTVLYIPCVSTLAVLWKEGGWKITLLSICLNTVVALAVAGGLSFAAGLFL